MHNIISNNTPLTSGRGKILQQRKRDKYEGDLELNALF